MSRFKIGQKVVCVKTHSQGLVKKGKNYIVKSNSCPCNCIAIDVGAIVSGTSDLNECYNCKLVYPHDNRQFICESLFAPLKEDGSSLSLTLELDIEEFELETIEYN